MSDCPNCGSDAIRRGECQSCGENVPQPALDAIRDRYHEALSQRDRLGISGRKMARQGDVLGALAAEKSAAYLQGKVAGLSFALAVLADPERGPTLAALLGLAETVALGDTDPDDLAAMAERLLGQVPEGCTGYRDRQGHMAHDGATCPIHEGAES